MVEGARLESACRGNPSTVGSNPTLSATLLTRVGPHTKKSPNSELYTRTVFICCTSGFIF